MGCTNEGSRRFWKGDEMLTEDERKELNEYRERVASRPPETREWMGRLIELERKDAAEQAKYNYRPGFEVKDGLPMGGWKEATPAPDFDAAPTTERKAPQTGSALLTLTHAEPGKFTPLDDEDMIDDDATIESTTESIPNPRTCGVARARAETGGESEPGWRKRLGSIFWSPFARISGADWQSALDADDLTSIDDYGMRGPPGTSCGWGGITAEDRRIVETLWPFEQLRRVVLAGQGEIQVPESVAKHLPFENWLVGTWYRDDDLWRYGDGDYASDFIMLQAIDAAATKALR